MGLLGGDAKGGGKFKNFQENGTNRCTVRIGVG
jgi:hypothetical protein